MGMDYNNNGKFDDEDLLIHEGLKRTEEELQNEDQTKVSLWAAIAGIVVFGIMFLIYKSIF